MDFRSSFISSTIFSTWYSFFLVTCQNHCAEVGKSILLKVFVKVGLSLDGNSQYC